jgi:polyisoprenoid-binding protein YceI
VPILGGLSTVTGKFAEFEIDFKLDAKDFTRSKVKVTIQAKSISTGITQRDAHLRTRDFFSVREFPEIVFVSKEIVEEDGGHAIRGQLTMHGTTREVVFSMKSAGTLTNESSGKTTMGFKGTAIINRDDFGIDYRHQSIEAFVGNQIKINLHILTKSVEL